MHKQRLVQVAEVLENFEVYRQQALQPVTEFSLSTWYRRTAFRDGKACALGLCGLLPQFQAEGLRINHRGNELYYYGFTNWHAARTFLEISHADCTKLFHSESYPRSMWLLGGRKVTPLAVAARIRAYTKTTPQSKLPPPPTALEEASRIVRTFAYGKLVTPAVLVAGIFMIVNR